MTVHIVDEWLEEFNAKLSAYPKIYISLDFIKITGSMNGGVMLTQAAFWQDDCPEGDDGWWTKTQDEWQKSTLINPATQKHVRNRLVDIGVLREKKMGIPCKTWYQLDVDRIQFLIDAGETIHIPKRKSKGRRYASSRAWSITRSAVLETRGLRCEYCGTETAPMQVDHVIPRSRGGGDDIDNLVVACRTCNIRKGARTPEEWKASHNVD